MTEFNPNCGKCGMLNSRGFCSLTACRYPSNVIAIEPKVIRGMMVNPQVGEDNNVATKSLCRSCAKRARCDMADCDGGESAITTCYGYERGNPTNADRIRAMTDEELAEYMSIYCCSHKTRDPRCQQFKDCGLCWLDWLKQEAKE